MIEPAGELYLRPVGPGFQLSLRRLDIAYDDHEEVIEIVRHATCKVADRLKLLRLAKGFLGGRPPIDLLIQMHRSTQYREQRQEHDQGNRYPEDQMGRHAGDPLVPDGRARDASGNEKRRVFETLNRKPALDSVDRRQ